MQRPRIRLSLGILLATLTACGADTNPAQDGGGGSGGNATAGGGRVGSGDGSGRGGDGSGTSGIGGTSGNEGGAGSQSGNEGGGKGGNGATSGGSTGGGGGGGDGGKGGSGATGGDGGDDRFPDATNTGVPPGVVLTAYTGPMTITVDGTVIDSKTITGDLRVKAKNVVVKNCKVKGDVQIDAGDAGYSFTIQDTEVDAGRALGEDAYDGTGIGARDFTALRVHVHGGKRGINCALNCTVQDSWVHGQAADATGVEHESAVRMGAHSTLRHNSFLCDAPTIPPDAGCSADLTGYGDFAVVEHNVIDRNLFKATTGGACAYGGSTKGKPYSDGTNNIQFTNNVFERGTSPSDHGTFVCGYYFAITDFDDGAPGNVWTGNAFDDGTALTP